MAARVADIFRYPVKSLSGEVLSAVELRAGSGIPHDRRFAIARASGRVNGSPAGRQSRSQFFTLADIDKLAQLQVAFDPNTGNLTLGRYGKTVTRGTATEPMGRLLIDQFLNAFLDGTAQVAAKLVEAKGFMFTEGDEALVSIVNLATLRDLERVVGANVDPLRFRANIYIDGPAPWAELGWPGRKIEIGSTQFEIVGPTTRGPATNVDPQSAERNLNLPLTLQRGFGHCNVGVYARILHDGEVAKGDFVGVPA